VQNLDRVVKRDYYKQVAAVISNSGLNVEKIQNWRGGEGGDNMIDIQNDVTLFGIIYFCYKSVYEYNNRIVIIIFLNF